MFLYKKSKIKSRKVNVLFAPGLPGKMTNRQIFEDLTDLGCDIYSFYYPGTYNETGSFDLDTAVSQLNNELEYMNIKGEPFIIIGYSFSSLLLQKLDLSTFQNILSLAFFSPVTGLDKDSINGDFYKELEDLQNIGENGFCCNFEKLNQQIKNSGLDFNQSLAKLDKYSFPVTFAYSLNDNIIRVEIIDEILKNYRAKNSYNTFLVWDFDNGYHGLDSYYNKNVSAYFEGLLISKPISKKFKHR